MKDTLRTIRFALRRGRAHLARPPVPLPTTVRATASTLLADFDCLALRVNDVLADLVHSVLDADGRARAWKEVRLEDLAAAARPEAVFAEVAYRALSHILRRLGAEEALISETRAAAAYLATGASPDHDRFGAAAALSAALIRRTAVQGVVRKASADAVDRGLDLAAVASFALGLWLVSARPEDEADASALLDASAELASALASELAAAGDDRAKLRELIATYADKL